MKVFMFLLLVQVVCSSKENGTASVATDSTCDGVTCDSKSAEIMKPPCKPGYGEHRGECIKCDCGPGLHNCTITGLSWSGILQFDCLCDEGYSIFAGKCKGVLCYPDPCNNRGICSLTPDKKDYICQCHEGFTGKQCENETSCTPDSCENGGTCVPLPEGSDHVCMCSEYYVGKRCQYTNLCLRERCKNGGTCTMYGDGFWYKCICPKNYTGIKCEIENPCKSNTCHNGGICTPFNNGSYACNCSDELMGDHCEISDQCKSVRCSGRGTCRQSKNFTDYNCICDAGYSGKNCEIECNKTCGANEECFFGNGTMSCRCKDGHARSNGECKVCNKSCGTNEMCYFQGSQMACWCKEGYWKFGVNCTESICITRPCGNNGYCFPKRSNTDYTCYCYKEYFGKNCSQTDICSIRPCENNGICTSNRNGTDYSCTCREGYFGKNCSQKTHYCRPNPCLNFGTCISTNSSYRCVCDDKHNGIHCENDIKSPFLYVLKETSMSKSERVEQMFGDAALWIKRSNISVTNLLLKLLPRNVNEEMANLTAQNLPRSP